MALPLYLAMTAAEIRKNTVLPPQMAYMACHFSPYGTGLTNPPEHFPAGSLLILNDRTPIHGHDPQEIFDHLEDLILRFHCSGLLLDFQRPGCKEAAALVTYITTQLPCPVAVSHCYENEHTGPVLLPPPPLDIPLSQYLGPWKSREIWLEVSQEGLMLTLTEEGCTAKPLPFAACSNGFFEDKLYCHYMTKISQSKAEFTLYRTREDLDALLEEAESLGVTTAVGLWQELNCQESNLPDPRL